MTTLNEGRHAGEYIVSESNGERSREAIVIASGENLVAGAVLGEITASPGVYAEHDPGAADGTENASAILFDAVDATGGNAPGVAHVRDCEVNGSEIEWITGITVGDQNDGIASLEAAGIIVR